MKRGINLAVSKGLRHFYSLACRVYIADAQRINIKIPSLRLHVGVEDDYLFVFYRLCKR